MEESNAIQKDTFVDSESFEMAQRVATAYSKSTMVPQSYQGNLSNCLIAMELANRIGASIFAVMQKLAIINGKPSFESTFLIATVNSNGRFTPLRYAFEGKEGTDSWGCRAVAKDKEADSECIGPRVTVKMAKDQGWWGKKGSKWPSMTELMLMYRSAAFWTRVYAPELSMGMHTRDELEDSQTVSVGPATVIKNEHANPLDNLAEQLKKQPSAEVTVEPEPEPKENPIVDPESGEVDVLAELMAAAKEEYGDKYMEWIEKKAGCKVSQMEETTINDLLDYIIDQREAPSSK